MPRAGAVIAHPRPDDGRTCEGVLHFNVAALLEHNPQYVSRVWEVQSWDPLTLTPSILCRECGDHGFITGGRWVPA